MLLRRVALLVLVLSACGDDGTHHLADAPPAPDGDVDAPGSNNVDLTVTKAGAGAGTITSSPAGIACGTDCRAAFAKDTVVTLTAEPETGSVFAGWSGACTGTVPTCDVTLADAKSVTATFDVATYTVTVTRMGPGMGTVTGSGVSCGTTCTVTVEHGTMITLAAAPGNLSVFAGWGGACSGTTTCAVTVTGTTAITANFALDNLTLFVTKGGNGTGTITSSPAGISCGTDCSETYVANQMITLTAMPGTGSNFTGWSGGGCMGQSTCTVTMTAAITVTATFTLQTHTLTVSPMGNGSGSVSSVPAGIACGTDCSQVYNYNTMVTLTAAASVSSNFTGWGAPCSGTGTCTVAMTVARTVTATFTLKTFNLTVARSGSGTGTISGNGINCGATCMATVNYGTVVTLTQTPSPTPATASKFDTWSGMCSGTGGCSFTMMANASVGAQYTLLPNYMFVSSKTFNGNLGGISNADSICKQLAIDAALPPGTYLAYLSTGSPSTILAPSRFLPYNGWVRVDDRPVMNDVRQMTDGTLFFPPRLDEVGGDVGTDAYAWTGTDTQGNLTAVCNPGWMGTSGEAYVGNPSATSSAVVQTTTRLCNSATQRLYCLGADRNVVVQ